MSKYKDKWWGSEAGKKSRDRARRRHRWKGLSLPLDSIIDHYDKCFEEQEGKCAICRQPEPMNRRLSLDHDHQTGQLRGLLCCMCNLALGNFEKYPEQLQKYLKDWAQK